MSYDNLLAQLEEAFCEKSGEEDAKVREFFNSVGILTPDKAPTPEDLPEGENRMVLNMSTDPNSAPPVWVIGEFDNLMSALDNAPDIVKARPCAKLFLDEEYRKLAVLVSNPLIDHPDMVVEKMLVFISLAEIEKKILGFAITKVDMELVNSSDLSD